MFGRGAQNSGPKIIRAVDKEMIGKLFEGAGPWEIASMVLVVVFLFVVMDTLATAGVDENTNLSDEKMRIYLSATLTSGILLWPVFWNLAVRSLDGQSGGDRMASSPRLLLGFVWPLLMLMVDLQHSRRRCKDGTFFESLQRMGYLKSDANTVITAAFAVGTLLVSLKRHSSSKGANLIMYAVMLCVAFVMPTSEVPATSRLSILIRASQKVCLNYAVGFVLGGIAIDLVN